MNRKVKRMDLEIHQIREAQPHRLHHVQPARADERVASAVSRRDGQRVGRLRRGQVGVGRDRHGRRRQGLLSRQRFALDRGESRGTGEDHSRQGRLRRNHRALRHLQADHRGGERIRARRRIRDRALVRYHHRSRARALRIAGTARRPDGGSGRRPSPAAPDPAQDRDGHDADGQAHHGRRRTPLRNRQRGGAAKGSDRDGREMGSRDHGMLAALDTGDARKQR